MPWGHGANPLTPRGRLPHNFAAMTNPQLQPKDIVPATAGSTLARLIKIVLIVFGLIVAIFALVVWFSGDQTSLPFNYDGFN